MAHNKIVLVPTGEVLIDLTQDTATEADVVKGKTFHRADGEIAEGTLEPKEDLDDVLYNQELLIKELKNTLDRKSAGSGDDNESTTHVYPKDVNFYDYDGTLLYSYTNTEASGLIELPELPSHEGLICQGWNWELYNINMLRKPVDVSATYITDDGKTRLYITIAADGRMTVPLQFNQTVANGVTIDWGDGSDMETVSSTGGVSTSHTYTSVGDYVISLDVCESCKLILSGDYLGGIMGSSIVYSNMLQKAELGNRTEIGSYAFHSCHSLTSITIPNGVISIGSFAFQKCYSLKAVMLPDELTNVYEFAFDSCHSLASVSIPNSIMRIEDRVFQYCYALSSIVLPSMMVMDISRYMFYGCYALSSVTIYSSTGRIYNNAFDYCYALSSISLNDITDIEKSAFSRCTSLASIEIPHRVRDIPDYAFNECRSLASVVIPPDIRSIGAWAFGSCISVAYYDFTNVMSVPTLSDTTAFAGIPSDCEIRVPDFLYDEWIAATNWSTYADKIVAAIRR
jgi:hypothetical protein